MINSKRWLVFSVPVVMALAILVAFALGWAAESRDNFESNITAALRSQNAAAADLFAQANEARARNEHHLAAQLYGRVYGMVPGFVHALRRQCVEVASATNRSAALPLCREAVKKDASAENFAALASIILRTRAGEVLSQADTTEALELAAKAVELKIDDPVIYGVLCEAGIAANSGIAVSKCLDELERIAPNQIQTQIFKIIFAVGENRFEDAERILTKARSLGMSESDYRRTKDFIQGSRPLGYRLGTTVGLVGAIWFAGFAILSFLGWVLSQLALKTAAKSRGDSSGAVRGVDSLMRRIYQVVLWLCCAYYYISWPLIALTVLVLGGGFVYAFIAIGHIPFKAVFLVLGLVAVTIWAIVKSLVVRVHDQEPGLRLRLEEHPRFANLLNDVALAVGTPCVDSVYVTPGTDLAVTERGGLFRQLTNRNERCLILGVAVLEGMRLGPFRAILAHEYGHLSNRDTAGGGFALAVRRSLVTMAQNLAIRGAANWYNPAWLFLNAFYRIFLRVSQGASRLQEVFADRRAALLYGAVAFEEGLRHVIAQSIRFDAHLEATLREIIEANVALPNLYKYKPVGSMAERDVKYAVSDVLARPASPYDSHPSPIDRFTYVRALSIMDSQLPADHDAAVWSLFSNQAALELEMTNVVRKNVQADCGVEIPLG